MIPHIETPGGLTIVVDGRPRTVSSQEPFYEKLVKAVRDGESIANILTILDYKKEMVKTALQFSSDLKFDGTSVLFRGYPISGYAVDLLISMAEKGVDVKPLARFLEKLMRNPSKSVVDNLYSFLEHGKIPLTVDGNFLAYKAVRKDFRDIHSGMFSNTVGSVLEMPRNQVDEDRNQTCSYGFHVCSFDYLQHFAHADGHVMVCSVSPEDVVAIPSDYNDTKMRVCRYTVVDEVTDYYKDKQDVLAETLIHGDEFSVFGVGEDGLAFLTSCFDLEEAKLAADEEDESNGWLNVVVKDVDGDIVYKSRC